jgi:hypothetical protein
MVLLEAISTLRLEHVKAVSSHDTSSYSTATQQKVSSEAQRILAEIQMYMGAEMTTPLALRNVPSFFIQQEKREEAALLSSTSTYRPRPDVEEDNNKVLSNNSKSRRSWMAPSVVDDNKTHHHHHHHHHDSIHLNHIPSEHGRMDPSTLQDSKLKVMIERMTSGSKLMLRLCVYDLVQKLSTHHLNGS